MNLTEEQRIAQRERELRDVGWLRRAIRRVRCDHSFELLHEGNHVVAAGYCFRCGKWWRPGFWSA